VSGTYRTLDSANPKITANETFTTKTEERANLCKGAAAAGTIRASQTRASNAVHSIPGPD
jgi:hypothetical protein